MFSVSVRSPILSALSSGRTCGNAVSHGRCPRSGFTFLELMIVVVILGIIFAFSIPRFQMFYLDARAKNAARKMVDLSRLLREKAILEQSVYSLNFDASKGGFIVSHVTQDNAEIKDTERSVRLSLSGEGGLPVSQVRISFLKGEWPLRFFPDGTMDEVSFELNVNGTSNSTIIKSSSRGLKLQD